MPNVSNNFSPALLSIPSFKSEKSISFAGDSFTGDSFAGDSFAGDSFAAGSFSATLKETVSEAGAFAVDFVPVFSATSASI